MSAFTILDLDPDLGCGISLITQQTSQKRVLGCSQRPQHSPLHAEDSAILRRPPSAPERNKRPCYIHCAKGARHAKGEVLGD